GVLINGVVVIVVQDGCGQGERPILELLGDPVVRLCICPLEAHILGHRLVHEGHGQGNHTPVAGHIPCGFNALLHHIQLVEGVKEGQILVCCHGFFLDEVVFRQVHRLVLHKGRRGGQGGHQPQQAVPGDKFQYCLFHFCFRLAPHQQHPHIQRIQHNVGGFFQRIVDLRLCVFAGGDVPLPVPGCFHLVMVVPHPMGTGLLK